VEQVIVDASVLVVAERGGEAGSLLRPDDDVAIAAVTAAELLVGVELADTRRRKRRSAFVEAVLSLVPIQDYDLDVARAHAVLLAHARRAGRSRGAHDLIIAATAVARGRTVVTVDPSGFEDLPGVRVRGG
jgi:tRNA(fMet)-specific endonuclease VapC